MIIIYLDSFKVFINCLLNVDITKKLVLLKKVIVAIHRL